MDVAQSHIVEGLKDRHIHIVCPAHGQLLRVAPGGAGNELVGDQYVSFNWVHIHGLNGHTQGVRIGRNLLFGEAAAYMGRFHKGQKINLYRTIFVDERNGRNLAVINRSQIDAAAHHQPPAEGHALR